MESHPTDVLEIATADGASPGVVTENPDSEFNRQQLALALTSDATAKPFAAGVYGFTDEGYPMGAAVDARSPLRQTTGRERFAAQDAYRADPRNRAWVDNYKQDGWSAPKGWRVCYGKGRGWCERTQIATWPLKEPRPFEPPNEWRSGWKGWFDRRNPTRIGEEPAPVVNQTGSTFQTTTHNPYDSDSLSSDDSEYEAQLIRRAERNERRDQEERDRIAAEEAAAAAAAATAAEEAYPHEPDASDGARQVAGMFAAAAGEEEGDGDAEAAAHAASDGEENAVDANNDGEAAAEQFDADAMAAEFGPDDPTSSATAATTALALGVPASADTEQQQQQQQNLQEMEASASAAMAKMKEELDELERRRIEREHQLASGEDWVDPATDGRKLGVEVASAQERDDEVKVQAVAEFAPLQLGDLGFSAGEILVVTDMSTPWWMGYRDGQPEQRGSFPSNYVKHYASGGKSKSGGKTGDGWKDTMMIELPHSSAAGP